MRNVLIQRRSKRGRPKKTVKPPKMVLKTVFVARDPQGVKLFSSEPKLSLPGLWVGYAGTQLGETFHPREFMRRYKNALVPSRGKSLKMKIGFFEKD